jgi:methylglutaconyl-CoA hydratase
MDKDMIILDVKHNIATVTFNRADVHNAFNTVFIENLTSILLDIQKQEQIIAVVLRGKGRNFSAGADLQWMKDAAQMSVDENRNDSEKLSYMLHILANLPQCTIAIVQGAAMGGGMGLVSCCDIVIAEKEAKFALSEVKIGLIPATIAPYVLQAIGPRFAKRYMQTGERIDAQTAWHIGLVHEVADTIEDMELILGTITDGLEANSPAAMKASKALALDFSFKDINDDLRSESADRIAIIRVTQEAQEGLSAFLEKRKPRWTRSA